MNSLSVWIPSVLDKERGDTPVPVLPGSKYAVDFGFPLGRFLGIRTVIAGFCTHGPGFECFLPLLSQDKKISKEIEILFPPLSYRSILWIVIDVSRHLMEIPSPSCTWLHEFLQCSSLNR
ncbi:MAG: hypothetical protein ACTSUE_26755 [Promethearchaeota archaeon]